MMRKNAIRRISSYDFGHPHMGTGFGGVVVNIRDPAGIVDHGVQRSKLPNGVTVITHDKSGPDSAIGFYADGGVKYDTYKAHGTTDLMKNAIFGSNMCSSTFQIDRALRTAGSTYQGVEVGKKLIGATTYGSRTTWRASVEQLAAAFAAPRFAEADIQRWRDHLDNVREETRWQNPREYAVNELETVAYYREALGNPRQVPVWSNDKISSDVLLDKYQTYFNPHRVTIVGVNVPHQDLIAEYTNQPYPHSALAPHHASASAPALTEKDESVQYVGAGKDLLEYENRAGVMKTKPDGDYETVVAVGWNTVGVDSGLNQYAAALVYREMMHIAANKTKLNLYNIAPSHGTTSFYRPFSTAGLIGFTIRVSPDAAVEETKAALNNIPTDFVSLLAAAKARAAVSFQSEHLETAQQYCNFLAWSPYDASSVLGALDATTVSGVSAIVESIKKTAPCMYATGETVKIPSLRQLGVKA